MKSRHFSGAWIALLLVLSLLLSSCRQEATDTTPTPTVTRTITATLEPTRLPTLTPTPHPLGSPENPFVIGTVAEGETDQTQVAVEELARRVAAYKRQEVVGQVFPNYPELLLALEEGRVHVTWLPPLTYLLASHRGLADVVMLTNHFGVYLYGAQYMANVSSGFTPYYDPISGFTSADAATALGQFANQRPCWVEPESTSGYIAPAGILTAEGISTLNPVFTQTHTAAIRALYIQGICDFGASFSISGDPRTSGAVLDDLPDAMNRVIVIWRTEPIIPNVNISFLPGLSDKDRQELIDALMDVNRTPEGKALLSAAAAGYQIDDLRIVEDPIYNPLRVAVDALDLDLQSLIGK